MPSTPDFVRLIQVLCEHDVQFILVGGVCAVAHGAPITTFDMDIVHARTPENIERLKPVQPHRLRVGGRTVRGSVARVRVGRRDVLRADGRREGSALSGRFFSWDSSDLCGDECADEMWR